MFGIENEPSFRLRAFVVNEQLAHVYKSKNSHLSLKPLLNLKNTKTRPLKKKKSKNAYKLNLDETNMAHKLTWSNTIVTNFIRTRSTKYKNISHITKQKYRFKKKIKHKHLNNNWKKITDLKINETNAFKQSK